MPRRYRPHTAAIRQFPFNHGTIRHHFTCTPQEPLPPDNYGIIIPAGYINYVSADGRFVLGTKAESSVGGVSFINWYIAPPVAK